MQFFLSEKKKKKEQKERKKTLFEHRTFVNSIDRASVSQINAFCTRKSS